MSLKVKLTSFVMGVIFAMSMMIVGVLSVSQVNLGIGGNVTFTAKGLNCTISEGSLNYGTKADGAMKGFTYSTTSAVNTTEETAFKNSWKNLDLTLNENELNLTFSITNNSSVGSFDYIKVTNTLSNGTMANMNNIVIKSKSSLESEYSEITIDYISPNETRNYCLTFSVIDKTINGSITGFEIGFLLELVGEIPLEEESLLNLIDENGMLNLGNELWQYSGYLSGDTFVVSDQPKAGQIGVFITELTPIYENGNGYDDWGVYDSTGCVYYQDSEIRAYLNSGEFYERHTWNIGEESEYYYVFDRIVKRSLESLYSDFVYDSTTDSFSSFPVEDGIDASAPTDNFWLLSMNEFRIFNYKVTSLISWSRTCKYDDVSDGRDYVVGIETESYEMVSYLLGTETDYAMVVGCLIRI